MGLDPVTMLAGANILNGIFGGMSSSNAADTQAGAYNNSTNAQLQMFNSSMARQQPWTNAGGAALARLSYLLGLSNPTPQVVAPSLTPSQPNPSPLPVGPQSFPNDSNDIPWWDRVSQFSKDSRLSPMDGTFTQGLNGQYMPTGATGGMSSNSSPSNVDYSNAGGDFGSLARPIQMSDLQFDPGYQFRLQQGEQGLNNSFAAQGGVMSGAALKGLMDYNQGFASNEFGNAWNRAQTNQTNQFNRLASLAGLGQTSANQTMQTGAQVGANIGNNMVGIGNAQAAGTMGMANAIGGSLNGMGGYYMLRNLFGSGGSGGGGGYSPWYYGAGGDPMAGP